MTAETAVELGNYKYDWREILNEALETPGAIGTQYSAFHSYSYLNRLLLLMQGAREPTASYKRWQALGRQVMKGSKGLVIVRPVTIKREDAEGNEVRFTRFKQVRGAFTYSMTEGEPLTIPETTEWSTERALRNLDIEQVPFDHIDGNPQGYSYERKVAINPVAKWPAKTTCHEIGHIELGHTADGNHAEYLAHRGRFEFQAEATALLVTKEVGLSTEQQDAESRGYLQGWMQGERPSAHHIRQVFKCADAVIRAGQVEVETAG